MKLRVQWQSFVCSGYLFLAIFFSAPLSASTCGPSVNFASNCAEGYYTLDTTLQMYVTTNFGDANATLTGTTVLYLQPVDEENLSFQVVNMNLSGGGFSLTDTGSQGWFYENNSSSELPEYNAGLAIFPDTFMTPWGEPDLGGLYASLPYFDFFSYIDRFPPTGTHWWIWPSQPQYIRGFEIPDYWDGMTLEGFVSKDPNQTWLVFNELISYSETATSPVPLPAALWLFISGVAGILGFSCKRRGRRPVTKP